MLAQLRSNFAQKQPARRLRHGQTLSRLSVKTMSLRPLSCRVFLAKSLRVSSLILSKNERMLLLKSQKLSGVSCRRLLVEQKVSYPALALQQIPLLIWKTLLLCKLVIAAAKISQQAVHFSTLKSTNQKLRHR